RALLPLRDWEPVAARAAVAGSPDPDWLTRALEALADEVRRGRVPRLRVERFDGELVLGTAAGALLVEVGFREGPRRLTLSA
ncbi:MAG: hypothetical protein ACR2GL_05610, partial [Thermoleophilaceae bacterium]